MSSGKQTQVSRHPMSKDYLRSPELSHDPVMRNERIAYIWFHAVAIGILQATFQQCNELAKGWIRDYTEQFSMELAANFKEFLDNVSNNDRLGRELNKAAKAGDLRYAGKEKLITVILPDDVSKS